MPAKLRAIVGARVSVLQGQQKVSHIAQIETATKWAEANGYKIVGSFEDLGVSASVRPDERPDLGQWLTDEGAAKWDVIIWSKMDRAFRSTRHCVDFAKWAEERQKVVVFAEDGLKLDYRPKRAGAAKGIDEMMAELFVYLGSFFAQLELSRFKTRAEDSHRVLRGTDRWASGVPPLGFKVVDHPSGRGKGLARDIEGYELLQEMAEKLLAGWSFIRIAAWLNEIGAVTNMDRARIAGGKEPKARPWTVNTIIDALTSPRTQGLKMTGKGRNAAVVLDGDGEPIRLAEPTFDQDTWKQVQEAAQKRQMNQRTPTRSVNPMLGVGFCGQCGASLAQQFSRRKNNSGNVSEHRYYRCGRTPINCKNTSVRADQLDQIMESMFLLNWGDHPVTRKVFVPGEDHSYELEQINSSIERLRAESDAGLIINDEDERMYLHRLKTLIDRRTKLEAVPARAAGWVVEETGQTYREVWSNSDHRQLLIDAGIQFVLASAKPFHAGFRIPTEQRPSPRPTPEDLQLVQGA